MYNSFYSFAESPFNVTPDPRFLFLTDSHREVLAAMKYGVAERKGFISVTGEVGTGKTTLVRRVLEDLRGKKTHCVCLYHSTFKVEQILSEVLHELDVEPVDRDKPSLIRCLNEFLLEGLARDEKLALIIDEAQNLDRQVLEELRLLSNLETSTSKLLQIVLVGQPELEAKLDLPELRQLKQRISIRRQIRPLTPDGSREYIEHRLKVVGSKSSQVFTSEAMGLICGYAQGIPRKINILCDNALLIGYGVNRKRVDGRAVREAIADLGEPAAEKTFAAPKQPPRVLYENGAVNGRAAQRRRRTAGLKPAFRNAVILCSVLVLLTMGFLIGRGYREDSGGRQSTARVAPSETPAGENKTDSLAAAGPTAAMAASPLPAPGPSKQETPKDGGARVVGVGRGETLSIIVEKNYGVCNPTITDKVLAAIADIHLLTPGQKVTLPDIKSGIQGAFK